MGVLATANTSAFFLPRARVEDALHAFRELAEREPAEFHDAAAVANASDFAAALLAAAWRTTFDDAGNVVELRYAGDKAPKESDDFWPLPMFRALSPLVAAAIIEVTLDDAPSTYVLLGTKVERWHDEPSDDEERRRRATIRRKARGLVAAARKRAKAPPAPKPSAPATKRRSSKRVETPPFRSAAAEAGSGPRVGMNLDFASEDDLLWHRDLGMMGALVEALEPNGLWFDFKGMSVRHEDAVRLDRRRLAKTIANWESGALELRESEDSGAPYVGIDTGGILCDLRLYSPGLDARRKHVFDGIIGWARVAASLIGDRACVRSGSIYPLDLSSELPEPAREHPLVRLGTLADFFGVGWCAREMPELVAAIVDGKLPEGASRIRYDDLLVLRWLDDATDPEEHVRACLRQQSWWVEHFPEPHAD